jgi:hypothetical protein
VAALELNSERRRGSGPRATWQHRSSPQQGDEVWDHGTRGGSRAQLCRRCGPNLQLAWQHVDARPAPCLNLELVCGGTRASGCRQGWASLGAKTSSWEQGPDFDLVGTSRMVVIRETPGVTRMTRWSGSSPAGCISIRVTVTLSDMNDRLSVAVILYYVLLY